MSAASLIIDGQQVSIGAVWVHCTSRSSKALSKFSLLVGGEFVIEVFDRWRKKHGEDPWDNYILGEMHKFPTPTLDACIETLRKIDGVESLPKSWVLTRVETVKIVDGGILVEGFAERFDRRRVPKPIPLKQK